MMHKKVLGTMLLLLIAGMFLSGCATPEDEYNKTREYIQSSVRYFVQIHGGSLPQHGILINISECLVDIDPCPAGYTLNSAYLLDFCFLKDCAYPEDCLPFELPICCYGKSGEEGTNFYTGNCTNPYQGHYVWLVDEVGNVCSVCVGDDCWANNESGYQGVWP
jgi:hypothetical protein